MSDKDKKPRRTYRAPSRKAAAARTRTAIVSAARDLFEVRGWSGTTVAAIAEAAGVSQKTVEAVFGTKAALLQAAVDYAIRGDVEPDPMPQRDAVRHMESVPGASEFLRLHAAHLRTINERSARLAWTVEHAAGGNPSVATLWERMNENRAYGVAWAASTLLRKTGRKRRLQRRDVEALFWVALDWGTYRTLTQQAGLSDRDYERWLLDYYTATLLPTR